MNLESHDNFKKANSNAPIAIVASFTADPLLPALNVVLQQAGLDVDSAFCSLQSDISGAAPSTGPRSTNVGGLEVVLARFEDFVREVENIEQARATIMCTALELADALAFRSQRAGVPIVLAILPPSPRVVRELVAEIDVATDWLVERTGSLVGGTRVSPSDLERVLGDEHYDSERDELAHVPYTEEGYASIAIAVARKVHALRIPARKVLVLDCDGTLWRGIVGEDGVEGISDINRTRSHPAVRG